MEYKLKASYLIGDEEVYKLANKMKLKSFALIIIIMKKTKKVQF